MWDIKRKFQQLNAAVVNRVTLKQTKAMGLALAVFVSGCSETHHNALESGTVVNNSELSVVENPNTSEILRLRQKHDLTATEKVHTPKPSIAPQIAPDTIRKSVNICKASLGPEGSYSTHCDEALPDVCKTIKDNIDAFGGVYSVYHALSPITVAYLQEGFAEAKKAKWEDLDFEENLHLVRASAMNGFRPDRGDNKYYAVNKAYDSMVDLYYSSRFINLQRLDLNSYPKCIFNQKSCPPYLYRVTFESESVSRRKQKANNYKYKLNGAAANLASKYFFDPKHLKDDAVPRHYGKFFPEFHQLKDKIFVQQPVSIVQPNTAYIFELTMTSRDLGVVTSPVCTIMTKDG